MRNISFTLTKNSFIDGTKDVTRRLWKKDWVKPGDHMMGVEKAQGLKKGERVVGLGEIVVLVIGSEPVDEIIRRPYRHDGVNEPELRFVKNYPPMVSEMVREGFPAFTPKRFVEFFCRVNKCKPDDIIYRLVFRRVI